MSPFDMRCPGQNMMFWQPDDIYDVVCPSCGKGVEFWKDDARRTCACGHRFANPKRDLGCLAYCKYAEDCMPEMFTGESLQAIYRDRLIAALAQELNLDSAQRRCISEAAELGPDATATRGSDPKVATAAAILSLLAGKKQGGSGAPALDEQRAREILSKVETDLHVIDLICAVVWNRGGGMTTG